MRLKRLVKITWRDAKSEAAGWKPISAIRDSKPSIVYSVGWIVRDTKSEIAIVSSVVDDHCDGDLVIPKEWIVLVEKLVTTI